MKKITFFLLVAFLSNSFLTVSAQNIQRFEKIELLLPTGGKAKEKSVVVNFGEDSMTIEAKNSSLKKTFKYSEIKSAEYSYSKNPRWKTGLGLAAASLLFPPLLFIAIPVGFSKHRRHWLTIRSENDYAVLKLSKSNRKFFIPELETRADIKVEAVGEDK